MSSAAFDVNDAFREWLGIASPPFPPDHYAVLGIPRFENDLESIHRASLARTRLVRPRCLKYHEVGTQVLNAIALATVCLTDADAKARYDETLRAGNGRGTASSAEAPNRRLARYRSQRPYAVGVYLGNEFCSLSYADPNGNLESVGETGLPLRTAVYFFDAREIIVGAEAMECKAFVPRRVASGFIKHLGDAKWTFKLDGKAYNAEDLTAIVLTKLVNEASKSIGAVKEIVVSLARPLNTLRCAAVERAAQLAGLRVIDLADKAAAAAIDNVHDAVRGRGTAAWEFLEFFGNRLVLVFDLGAESMELTLLRLHPDYTYEIIARHHDPKLGGDDWNRVLERLLANRYLAEFKEQPASDLAPMDDLHRKAQDVKHQLSMAVQARMELTRNEDVRAVVISRGEFEQRSKPLLERVESNLMELLRPYQLQVVVDCVVPLGGASCMPMLERPIASATSRELETGRSPYFAVSRGAALFAAYSSTNE